MEALPGQEGRALGSSSLPNPQCLLTGGNAGLRAALWHFLRWSACCGNACCGAINQLCSARAPGTNWLALRAGTVRYLLLDVMFQTTTEQRKFIFQWKKKSSEALDLFFL